jgi:diguanylate cyclase (GGDEF)-like protein
MTWSAHPIDPAERHSVDAWHLRGLAGLTAYLAVVLLAAKTTDSLNSGLVAMAAVVVGAGLALAAARDALTRLLGDVSLLIWPLLAMAALTSCVALSRETAQLVLGGYVLAFLYIGITQPPRRIWWLIPIAAVSLVYALDLPPAHAAIRVALAVVVWALVAAWPAHLLAELRHQRVRLEESARTDALTGLNNRSRLPAALAASDRSASLLLIDLDHFKAFNDSRGHIAGDELLQDFATLLEQHCRAGDIAYRYGGEEFLVILPGTKTVDAREVARRLAAEWATREPTTTFSAGIAQGGPEGLHRADHLLYLAKRSGRAVTLADGVDDKPAVSRTR